MRRGIESVCDNYSEEKGSHHFTVRTQGRNNQVRTGASQIVRYSRLHVTSRKVGEKIRCGVR